jgi:hypothetical protein
MNALGGPDDKVFCQLGSAVRPGKSAYARGGPIRRPRVTPANPYRPGGMSPRRP